MVSSSDLLGDLEGLDRDTLLGLARARGLKVSSRSRKAEIIAALRGEGAGGASATARTQEVASPRAPRPQTAELFEPSPLEASGHENGVAAEGSGASTPAPRRGRRRSSGSASTAISEHTPAPELNEADRLAVDLARLLPPIAVDAAGTRPGTESLEDVGASPAAPPASEPVASRSQETSEQAAEIPRADGRREEPNSRRSRRRRGKDRGERGSEAETLQVQELIDVFGVLDLRDEGYGFLRANGRLSSPRDAYVPASMVRKFGLRKGDFVEGQARANAQNEKYPALMRIESVFGMSIEEARKRPRFEDLTPLFPDERLRLENADDPLELTPRIIDLIAPIGKGQRGLIVSPPKAGKTTIMKQIAHAIERNNPEVTLFVLLVDERPEEVTDMRRSVKGEVIASTFDRPAEEHTQVAELVIERAKRLVELGRDVVIILDGITRLARAYNLAQPASGRIMSGGVDSGALYPPKKFFGAARNVEEGGSLTILATALVETGSKMDEVIFEEFKGTGNMELRLDRRMAERRLFPAIDVNASSTRHEELLFTREELAQVWKLRRVLGAISQDGTPAAGLELLIDKIRTTRSNAEFLAEIARSPGI
jgi:transcription termination factor Rho